MRVPLCLCPPVFDSCNEPCRPCDDSRIDPSWTPCASRPFQAPASPLVAVTALRPPRQPLLARPAASPALLSRAPAAGHRGEERQGVGRGAGDGRTANRSHTRRHTNKVYFCSQCDAGPTTHTCVFVQSKLFSGLKQVCRTESNAMIYLRARGFNAWGGRSLTSFAILQECGELRPIPPALLLAFGGGATRRPSLAHVRREPFGV